MKTLHLSIIAVAGIVSIVTNSINLVSADVVPPPGPPPPVPVTIVADKQVYLAGDTITVSGRVDRTLLQTYAPLFIQFFNSGGIQVHGPDRIYENKDGSYTYHLKLEKTFGDTDRYNILITHDSNTYDAGTVFMFIAGPYNLVASGKTYPIYYTITSGKLYKISVDVNLKSMIVTIVNAPSSFSVELPRDLIDSKSGTSDTNFTVLIGEHNQPQKFMSKAKFDEIRNDSKTRTLLINFPYDETNPTGTWDVVIAGNQMVNESQIISPLKQFKAGISPNDIQCKTDFTLIFKAEDGTPACVKPETATKLVERGWAETKTGVSTLENPPVGLYNITTSTQPIVLGMPFYLNAIVVNHQTRPITYYGGCVSPLSISFDNIKTYTDSMHCLTISKYTLGPNENVPVHSDKIEALYNATGPNDTNAEIKFSYEIDGKQASIFTSKQLSIQSAIKLDCSKPIGIQVAQINKSVNVQKAIALAYTSTAFVAKVKQYGNVSYSFFYNDWFPDESCNAYWKGVEVMFTTTDKNGSRNIQVSEDINLTKVLNVTDFQVGFSK